MANIIVIVVLFLLLICSWRKDLIRIAKKIIVKFIPSKLVGFLGRGYHRKASSVVVSDPIYPVITEEQVDKIKHAIKLTFTGDLILLKDMVENGYNAEKGSYSFDSMFEYVKEYYDNADFNFGVLEGPVAGAEKGYSTSCFDDGIPIYLNFPREYAEAVKRTGFDLVSLANNHMLDQGIEGLYHTMNELDEIGLSYTGAYRNEQEKSEITFVTIKDKKVAVLAYTYGSNHFDTNFFYTQENKHLSRIIVSPDNKHIGESLKSVKQDFEEAKKESPDLIVVMPHMGKQFLHAPDDFQKFWCNVFVECGADIILSDHPHAVQPIEWRSWNEKQVLIVHCPGNFINSYTKKDGDASMIVECYLNPQTCKPFASACIPVYAYSRYGRSKVENYTGIPVYSIIKDEHICPELSRYEYDRISEVQKLVTKTALGVELGLDNLQKRYITFAHDGYVRQPVDNAWVRGDVADGCTSVVCGNYNLSGCKLCFIGDSLSEGTKNGGYGWFEPMVRDLKVKSVCKFTKGSKTTKYFIDNIDAILRLDSDIYFLAIGCNDIRYRNPKTCAMTESEYVNNMGVICTSIIKKHPSAKIVCISPWESGTYDPFCKMTLEEKEELYAKYDSSLKSFCENNGFVYINPNPYIKCVIKKRDGRYYLIDHIHCNADQGIELYSEAVLNELKSCDFFEFNNNK